MARFKKAEDPLEQINKVLASYRAGTMSRIDAVRALKALGKTITEAGQLLARGRFLRIEDFGHG